MCFSHKKINLILWLCKLGKKELRTVDHSHSRKVDQPPLVKERERRMCLTGKNFPFTIKYCLTPSLHSLKTCDRWEFIEVTTYPWHLYHEAYYKWSEAFKICHIRTFQNSSHQLHVAEETLFTISKLGIQKTHKMANFWPGWIGNPAVTVEK